MNAPKRCLAAALLLALPACSTLAGVEELSTGQPGSGAAGAAGGVSPNGGAAGRANGGASGASGGGTAGGPGGASAGTGGAAGLAGQGGASGDGGSMGAGAAAGATSGGAGGAAGTNAGGASGVAGTSAGGASGVAGTSAGGASGVAGTSAGGASGAAGTSAGAGGSTSGAGGSASGAAGSASGAGGSAGSSPLCGNGVVDVGEECDASPLGTAPPCNQATCRLLCSAPWAYRDVPTGACFFVAGEGEGETASWPGAKVRCAELGARLATFQDASLRSRVAIGLPITLTLWVGARQQAKDGPLVQPDDGWIWDGAPGSPSVAASSWAPGQPDDGNATENGFQDCAVVNESSGLLLSDRGCGDLERVLCVAVPR